MNKVNFLNFLSKILLLIGAVLFICILFLTFSYVKITDGFSIGSKNPSVIPLVNEVYTNTDDMFHAVKLENGIEDNALLKDMIIKRLLKEYVVQRYTIVPNAKHMQRIFGDFQEDKALKKNLNPSTISPVYLKNMKFVGYANKQYDYSVFGMDDPTKAWLSFMDKDRVEMRDLFSKGVTRSVRILKEPYEDNDIWQLQIAFIYKGIEDFEKKRVETLNIRAQIEFGDAGKENYFRYFNIVKDFGYPVSSIFNFRVLWIEKDDV